MNSRNLKTLKAKPEYNTCFQQEKLPILVTIEETGILKTKTLKKNAIDILNVDNIFFHIETGTGSRGKRCDFFIFHAPEPNTLHIYIIEQTQDSRSKIPKDQKSPTKAIQQIQACANFIAKGLTTYFSDTDKKTIKFFPRFLVEERVNRTMRRTLNESQNKITMTIHGREEKSKIKVKTATTCQQKSQTTIKKPTEPKQIWYLLEKIFDM